MGINQSRVVMTEPLLNTDRLHGEADLAELRRSWGVADTRTRIVIATGDPPETIDALLAMLSVGLAAETGRPLRLLIGPHAKNLARARRVIQDADRPEVLIVHETADQPWESLGAVDFVLAMNSGPAICWAMAAGMPIVARDNYAARQQLSHDHTALLGRADSAGDLARQIIRLYDHPDLARTIADNARHTAVKRYSVAQNLSGWHRMYEQLAATLPKPQTPSRRT